MSISTFRLVKAPSRRVYRVVGRGRWTDYGCSWLCAHDLIHHLPDDKGLFEQELQTYGVESWLSGARSKDKNWGSIDPGAIAGPVFDAYNMRKRMAQFQLPPAPSLRQALPREQWDQIEAAVNAGFADAATSIAGAHEDAVGREMSQAALDHLVSEENQSQAAGWIAYGFEQAQLRFPNPLAALNFFDTVEEFLKTVFCGEMAFKTIELELDFRALSLSPKNARHQKIWQEVCNRERERLARA